MFQKILIANRGEIALSIIRVCKEMGIKTVAVYSTADRDSLPVRFADEAVCIGPPSSNLSYLSIPSIIAAAEVTNSAAIHPGYGFLSENAHFAAICEEYGIKFIGPSAQAIRKMGDKVAARATMRQAGIPTLPGSDGLLQSVEEGIALAHAIGFPVLLKATAGGGGKGIKLVATPEMFQQKWEEARKEAITFCGQEGLYLEKYLEEPRHIEIQVAVDRYGKVMHLSERDCSTQRRHQKLVEEAPSPFMTAALRTAMTDAALKGVASIGYEGVGTIEFLVDKDRNFYFMEMNTRIQVEYPVTEAVTNCNLLRMQIELAAGQPLQEQAAYPKGHAIEVRINAEDPFNDFRPSPGKITHVHFPGGRGVTISSHIYAGYVVPPHYDSLLAKIIVRADNRMAAVARMKRVLEELVIEGICTNVPFYLALLEHPSFQQGAITTSYLNDFDFSLLKKSE
ncbi:MAG: acetyl-CoA carboxylase biotin carboxylase subunit [Candidatus Cardinium sp.]|nr:acetyl-CoA carboxylase biotin carboxylase subunit [Candidatus Cardinium sp.]